MPPRIAFLPDSFHEVNGVAHTARKFVDFAERRGVPMLCVCAGGRGDPLQQRGAVEFLRLDRGHWAVRLEQDLTFDPYFFRHAQAIGRALKSFRPDLIHITGPSELGLFGAFFARRYGIPLVASWHTNLHEYARQRLGNVTGGVGSVQGRMGRAGEAGALAVLARLYRRAEVLYAPNPPLCRLLRDQTGRPCHVMARGVDTDLFAPHRRTRPRGGPLTLGYVGRLSVEKNVALLPQIQRALHSQAVAHQWVIVGHGSEERSLRQALGPGATFAGVLRGQHLAEAYANMDLFVFPSHTDTFGNVVLEALASGVPAIVTPDGGPAHIVQDGGTGCVAEDAAFPDAIRDLASDPERLHAMGCAARTYALTCTWDSVFERVLAAYPAT